MGYRPGCGDWRHDDSPACTSPPKRPNDDRIHRWITFALKNVGVGSLLAWLARQLFAGDAAVGALALNLLAGFLGYRLRGAGKRPGTVRIRPLPGV